MSVIDWCILCITLIGIIIFGLYKSRNQQGAHTYLMAGRNMPWYTVLLGIMATQASAITFLSAPGQAYTDGMRFVQYYFGLPIAMIVISAVFIPIFQKQNVFTAYEYLDKRFDRKTRLFTGFLFLFSRGISTGMSIYAPAIVLSAIFGWNIYLTNVLTGGFLVLYTYWGGAQSVAHTQRIQFIIILVSMAMAGFLVVFKMPAGIGFTDALYLAGSSGKLNVITTNFDWKDKYNIWSGIFGGFFLALSYFGTDQSQVGRYLSGKDLRQSRLGILMNGMVKIPMQFLILLIGALLFVFYTLVPGPLFFNEAAAAAVNKSNPEQYKEWNVAHTVATNRNREQAKMLAVAHQQGATEAVLAPMKLRLNAGQEEVKLLRKSMSSYIKTNNLPVADEDTNYIFLHFARYFLPIGMVGLIFAIIFLASWGSISAALNSLASATLMDFHQLLSSEKMSETDELKYGRLYTLLWSVFGIGIAMFATRMGSLIEAVNVLGSLFYGPMLGVFLVGFFLKKVRGTAVFIAAILAEVLVFVVFYGDWVGFLWLNVIGSLGVVLFASLLQVTLSSKSGLDAEA